MLAETSLLSRRDAYYWLVTSDQLAQDKAVYGTLESLPSKNHQRTDVYITAPLSHSICGVSAPSRSRGQTQQQYSVRYAGSAFRERRKGSSRARMKFFNKCRFGRLISQR